MQGRNTALIRRYFPNYRSPKLRYQALARQHRRPGHGVARHRLRQAHLRRRDAQPRTARPRRFVVGVDRDPHLREHDSMRDLVRCDAAALPFRDGAFNLVTGSMVVEHLERPDAVLGEIARVCGPGARVVVFTPNLVNYAMIVAAATPYRFHLWYKRITHFFARGDWTDLDDDVFPTYYRANTVARLRKLMDDAAFRVERLEHVSMAHSFGFVKPLYIASLLFERLIDRRPLEALKADILGVFVRGQVEQGSRR